ncbi:MAG: hypothetical protein HQL66_10775 [Magnetococcales bacterium]|nr:hypothetical protein [Magnetococcales bacterium]
MNTAERIYTEVKRLPEEQAAKVLDFIHTLETHDESAHAAKAAMAALLAHPAPLKEGETLPMKRNDLYDRPNLR